MKLSKEQVACAVQWWCEQLGAPKVDIFGSSEARNAKENQPAAMAEVMLIGLQAENRPTEQQLETFRRVLTKTLEHGEHIYHISTDYGPDHLLSIPAKAAGFGQFTLPVKTIMWFSNDGVQVAAGYGAASEEILKKEKK